LCSTATSSMRTPGKPIHMRVRSSTIFTRGLSQCGQRRTIPAPRKTWIAPTASVAPQLPQVAIAVVISTANTSRSKPAIAFPSSINASASISAPSRSEALGLDSLRVVPQVYKRLCHALHERRRAADVNTRLLVRARADLREHLGVDAARVARPTGRLRVRQRVHHRETVAVQPLEVVPVDDVVPAARGAPEAPGHDRRHFSSLPWRTYTRSTRNQNRGTDCDERAVRSLRSEGSYLGRAGWRTDKGGVVSAELVQDVLNLALADGLAEDFEHSANRALPLLVAEGNDAGDASHELARWNSLRPPIVFQAGPDRLWQLRGEVVGFPWVDARAKVEERCTHHALRDGLSKPPSSATRLMNVGASIA